MPGPEQRAMARRLYEERVHSVAEIGRLLGVSRSGVYRALAKADTASDTVDPQPAATAPAQASPAAASRARSRRRGASGRQLAGPVGEREA